MRMFGPTGNPQARNLFEIVAYLQHAEGVRFEVRRSRPLPREDTSIRLEGKTRCFCRFRTLIAAHTSGCTH